MKLNFGKHKGKTLEWVFFNDPHYAKWLHDEEIHEQPHCFDELQKARFLELYKRASHPKAGTCSLCKQSPAKWMTYLLPTGTVRLGGVFFRCEECPYFGSTPTSDFDPSFFNVRSWMPRKEQKMVTGAILEQLMGNFRMTKRVMEEFFANDANFTDCTPGFFNTELKKAA